MAKLKLKLKKSITEKLSLVEHVTVENATFIGTGNGFDVFDIRTFDAMQTFKVGDTDTPCDFTNGRNEFDSHITNGTIHLYLFVQEDTYKCYGAVISGQTDKRIKYNDSQSTLVCNICFEDIQGAGNNIPGGVLVPLYLVPGITISPSFNTSDSQEILNGLATIGGVDAPSHEEPEPETTPAEPTQPTDFEFDDDETSDDPEDEEEVQNIETAEVSADDENPEVPPTTSTEEPSSQPAVLERSPFKYKIVGKEVYITHIRITPEMRESHTITIPETIEGKPVTKLWKHCLYIPDSRYWTIYFPSTVNEIKNEAILCQSDRYKIDLRSFRGKKYSNSIYYVGD